MEVIQCTFVIAGRVLGTFHVTEDYLTLGAPFNYSKDTKDSGDTSYLYVDMIETFTPFMEEDKFCVVSLTSRPPTAKSSAEDIGQLMLGSL
jgi:hypothetical protein